MNIITKFCIALTALAILAAPAGAVEDTDRTAIRSVIERQLNAFRQDDAAGAYGLAAPAIKQMFPDEGAFMRMVREGYGVVYRHKSVNFGPSTNAHGGVVQAVEFTDENGEIWAAVYSLEQQPDGSWLISGCVIARAKSERA